MSSVTTPVETRNARESWRADRPAEVAAQPHRGTVAQPVAISVYFACHAPILHLDAADADVFEQHADAPLVPEPLPVYRSGPGVTHGPDFAAVNWYGTLYKFTGKQRLIVAELFEARAKKFEWVSQERLLELAESDCVRLRDLFRGHKAWGGMIQNALAHGGPAGCYRLEPRWWWPATPPEGNLETPAADPRRKPR